MPSEANSSELDWASVEMSMEAREYYEKEFLPRYKKLQQQVDQTPLVVLIWGPGQSEGDLYEKRVQIRGALRQTGYAAVFSEEIDGQCSALLDSVKARELLQAKEADFIVAIIGSPGSIAEVHDFAGFLRDLASKMLIFIDSRHVGGYSYMGALSELKVSYGNVETYEYPRDIRECFLMSAVQKRLRVLRWAKWRARLT